MQYNFIDKMTAIEIATICISAGTLGVTLFLTYRGYKQSEKLANLQAELDKVNTKLELEQQFILEKKKFIFESEIKTIDELCENITLMTTGVPILEKN